MRWTFVTDLTFMALKNSTVFSEPAMIRLLTKAAHSLPVSPNTFMNPKWRLVWTWLCSQGNLRILFLYFSLKSNEKYYNNITVITVKVCLTWLLLIEVILTILWSFPCSWTLFWSQLGFTISAYKRLFSICETSWVFFLLNGFFCL